MSYKLSYDKLVRKRCHERRLMNAVPFGSLAYLRIYGRSPPVNGGVLAQTLARARGIRVSDIEKEHGHIANTLQQYGVSEGTHMSGRDGSYVNTNRGATHPREEIESDSDIDDPMAEYEAAMREEEYSMHYNYDFFATTPIPQMEGTHSPSHATTRLESTPTRTASHTSTYHETTPPVVQEMSFGMRRRR